MTSRRAMGHSLLLIFALACGRAGETPTAPTQSTPQTAGGSGAANEVPPPPAEEAPSVEPPVEPTVEPPTDIFAEDLAQAPSWVRQIHARRRSQRNWSVQVPDPARELEVASALGPGFVGVLICEVEVTERRNWDSYGLFGRHAAPEIALLGGSSSTLLQVRGPEDTYAFVASYANVQLDHGFVLHIRDRDTNSDDPIETLQLPVPTEPTPFIEVTGERARARCAGVPVAQAAERAQRSFNRLGRVLTRLEARSPAVAAEARRRLEPARRLARTAAAWLGWAHPSVRSVVQRLNVVAGLWAIADAETRAAPMGTESQMPRVVATVLDQACSDGICRARVRATYPRMGPVVSLVVLTRDGEVVANEVASDPAHATPPRRINTPEINYTHTFEWAGEAASFAAIRQNNDEVLVRLQ